MVISDAVELYKRIHDSGFDPRKGLGRDNALYLELQSRLGCLPGTGLPQFLKSNRMPADKFLEAFMAVAEPFSLMYRDIFAAMRKYGATAGTECLQIRLESKDVSFSIDLSDFERWYKTHCRIRQRIRQRLWTKEQFYQLADFLGMLGGSRNWNHSIHPEDRTFIPPPPAVAEPRFRDALAIVHNVLQAVADQIVAQERPTEADHVRALGQDRADEASDERLDCSLAYEIFPSVLGQYQDLSNRIVASEWHLERLPQALTFFDRILAGVRTAESDTETDVELFDKILELPFWQYRWYVYEIWITLHAAAPLTEFGFKPTLLDGGVLPLKRAHGSELGEFTDQNGRRHVVAAQVTTAVPGKRARSIQRSICPDVRIASRPCHEADATIVIVECKQRRTMTARTLRMNAAAYEKGAPRSVANIFVNYDAFPSTVVGHRTRLISPCQPKNPQAIELLQRLIRDALASAGVQPPRPAFEAILLDVSGSMEDQYGDAGIQGVLLAFLEENPGCRVFYFNDDLIEPAERTHGTSVQTIRSRISGGTNLRRTLQTLGRTLPTATRIVVLTDGDYGQVTADLRSRYQLSECLPNAMAAKSDLWKIGQAARDAGDRTGEGSGQQ
ncbi:MAG: hypothetical protein PHU25_08455 [Deltaproteobacteria bacterium]|nr:hypothetical protein [Deltaproteobacteria bacterium]